MEKSDVNHPLFELFSLFFMALAWTVFISSTRNYLHVSWHGWLLASRVGMSLLGFFLLALIYLKKLYSYNLASLYLLLSVGIQASHGYLEGEKSVDFYNFIGIIFILSTLSFNGSLKKWLTFFLPLNLLFVTLPLTAKSSNFFASPGHFVDHFSLMVSGVIIGVAVLLVTTSRYEFAQKYLRAKIELGDLASQIAHDVRSPIEVLKFTLKDEMNEEEREIALLALRRLDETTQKLVAKIKGEKLEAELADLNLVIEELMREKRREASEKYHLQFVSSLTKPLAYTSIADFKSILSNLLNNAMEAMPEGGEILLTLHRERDDLIIQIKDHGCGLSFKEQKQLFRRGMSFRKPQGLGFGLYYAKRTLESWRGSIELNSSPGEGTIVSLSLPEVQA